MSLSSCEYYFIRVYENLVQHPSNNISIGNWWNIFFYFIDIFLLPCRNLNAIGVKSKATLKFLLLLLLINSVIVVFCSMTDKEFSPKKSAAILNTCGNAPRDL